MFGAGVIDDKPANRRRYEKPRSMDELASGLVLFGACALLWRFLLGRLGPLFLQALEGVFAWMEGILLAFPYESAGDAFGKSKGDQPTLSFLLQGVAG